MRAFVLGLIRDFQSLLFCRHVGSTAALFLSVFMQQRALIVPVGDQ